MFTRGGSDCWLRVFALHFKLSIQLLFPCQCQWEPEGGPLDLKG